MIVARIALLGACGAGVAALVSTHPATAQDGSTIPHSAPTPWIQPAPTAPPSAPEPTPSPLAPEPPSATEAPDGPTAPAPDPAPATERKAAAPPAKTVKPPTPKEIVAEDDVPSTSPYETDTVRPQLALTVPATAAAENGTTSGKMEAVPEANQAPNPSDIVGAGLFTFVVSYVPATMIAESSSARADRLLYVPVAGPWLDLARRPECSGACNAEFGNRALLAIDGMLQDVGALMTVVGLLSEGAAAGARTAPNVQARSEHKVHVSPANFGPGGYGIAAAGRF